MGSAASTAAARQRMGGEGRQRERHRPRLYRHQQHRRPSGRRDAQSPDRRAHSRRALGQPADLGGAAVFLASSASDGVNGHILAVDGRLVSRTMTGWTCRGALGAGAALLLAGHARAAAGDARLSVPARVIFRVSGSRAASMSFAAYAMAGPSDLASAPVAVAEPGRIVKVQGFGPSLPQQGSRHGPQSEDSPVPQHLDRRARSAREKARHALYPWRRLFDRQRHRSAERRPAALANARAMSWWYSGEPSAQRALGYLYLARLIRASPTKRQLQAQLDLVLALAVGAGQTSRHSAAIPRA